MLYVRGNNGDTDDAEYYVNHLVFAVLPELDGDILYTVLSFKAAPRWLRHDRQHATLTGLSPNIYFFK